jgi:hypothetical protein
MDENTEVMMDMEDFWFYMRNAGAIVAVAGVVVLIGAMTVAAWKSYGPMVGIGAGALMFGVLASLLATVLEEL